MLAKGQRPVIGRLTELLVSRRRPAIIDVGSTSPTSHFDVSPLFSPSPRANLKTFNGGSGVGLAIVAALDHCNSGSEILVKHPVFSPGSGRPTPIPADDEENYTHVTTRGPHRTSTRIYYDGGESDPRELAGRRISGGGFCRKSKPVPALRSCCLCGEDLEGSDIYMYREKAFCTPECRSKQMTRDEMKERCGSEASRSGEVSYNRGEIFSNGILAI